MPRTRRELIRFAAALLIGLAIAAFTAFNVLLIWVATGPRSLERLSPYIEEAFERGDGAYSLDIGQTWLIWDGWKHPIDVRLRDVRVLTREGQVFSKFPEISLGLDIFALMVGKVLPKSVTIEKPVISLFQNVDRSINFGFRSEGAAPLMEEAPTEELLTPPAEVVPTVPFMAVLEPLLKPDRDSRLRKLRSINIRDANVSLGNLRRGVFLQATRVNFLAKRNRQGTLEIATDARVRYSTYQSDISARLLFMHDKPTIDGSIEFKGVEPSRLASFFSESPYLKMVKLPLSGKVDFSVDMGGSLQRAGFIIESGMGEIDSDDLVAPVQIGWAHVQGQLSNDLSDIQIKDLRANVDGMLFAGEGEASLNNGDAAIRANVNLKNASADKVPLLWPPELAPMTREWVTGNITEGTVPQASARINIKHGDLAKPILPKEAIDATIALEGGKIRYLPEHPEVTNASGVIHIDGLSLDVAILSADYLKDSKITGGKLMIEDLNAENPYIRLNFTADASAKDVVRVLRLPELGHAEHLALKEDSISGRATGEVALGFHFFAPRDAQGNPTGADDIAYDVKAEFKEVSQPGFMQKFDISKASGSFTVNKEAVGFKGRGTVNGATTSDTEVKYLFVPEAGFDTFIDVKAATAPVEALPRFGYPLPPFMKGTLGVTATVKLGEKSEAFKAGIDLAGAAINMTETGWIKPVNEGAKLELTAEKKGGVTDISNFELTGKNINVKGSATLNKELSAVERVTLARYALGASDLNRVYYETTPGGYRLEIQGKSADLGSWMEKQRTQEGTLSFKHFPAIQFKGDIAQLILGQGRYVSGFKGNLNCTTVRCESADFTGKAGEKPFNLRILRNPKGKRQLSLHTQDAGSFLRAFGLFESMQGGDLALIGNYDDSGGMRGRLDIREYVLKDAPILAKILSLASLTGFFDTLQGKGIRFVRLSAPFGLQNDIIAITKAKAYGPAVGLTIDGTITMPKMLLDLQGTVVPSYTLNSVLGKVPLFGALLTGGEGQGVFAARYSVRGTEKDPEVRVNPLAILTPGFLRGLFDIMDGPKDSEEQINGNQ
jgi:hypothetical protein